MTSPLLCTASRDCLNLSMAYHILITIKPPDHVKTIHQELLKELKPFYPCGKVCPLETNPNVVDLLNKTINFLKKYGTGYDLYS